MFVVIGCLVVGVIVIYLIYRVYRAITRRRLEVRTVSTQTPSADQELRRFSRRSSQIEPRQDACTQTENRVYFSPDSQCILYKARCPVDNGITVRPALPEGFSLGEHLARQVHGPEKARARVTRRVPQIADTQYHLDKISRAVYTKNDVSTQFDG